MTTRDFVPEPMIRSAKDDAIIILNAPEIKLKPSVHYMI
jgi:hypothetical protein